MLYYKIIRIQTAESGIFDGETVKSGTGTLESALSALTETTDAYNWNAVPSIFALYTIAESEIHNPKSVPVLRGICGTNGLFTEAEENE